VVEGRSKLKKNVEHEAKVNAGVENSKKNTFEDIWVETELEGYAEAVVESEDDDEELPLSFTEIVLADHEFFVSQYELQALH